jgi:phosphohistidine swiveling domain-containing protein
LAGWKTARTGQKLFDDARQQVEPILAALRETREAGAEEASIQLRQQIVLFQHIAVTRLQLNIAILLVSLGVKQATGLTAAEILAVARPAADSDPTDFNRALDWLVNLTRDSKWFQSPQADNDIPQSFAGQLDMPLKFQQQLDDFSGRFPDHGDYPADPGQPRYGEAPNTLLALLKRRMQISTSPSSASELPTTSYSWRHGLAQPLIKNLRQLLQLRNDLEQLNILSMAACRRWGQRLGHEWLARGWLAQAEDIFWLTVDEIEQVLVAGESKAVTLSATVTTRRANYAAYRDMRPPVVLQEDTLATVQFGGDTGLDATASVIVGLPVSPGQIRGTVVVLDEPNIPPLEIDELILVLPSTGPDWLPLLHRAAGLIVETGGLLSHGSVIAREYEIPAVANIPHATQRYQNGDRVLVDGSTGVVQLLETSREVSTAAQK